MPFSLVIGMARPEVKPASPIHSRRTLYSETVEMIHGSRGGEGKEEKEEEKEMMTMMTRTSFFSHVS